MVLSVLRLNLAPCTSQGMLHLLPHSHPLALACLSIDNGEDERVPLNSALGGLRISDLTDSIVCSVRCFAGKWPLGFEAPHGLFAIFTALAWAQ